MTAEIMHDYVAKLSVETADQLTTSDIHELCDAAEEAILRVALGALLGLALCEVGLALGAVRRVRHLLRVLVEHRLELRLLPALVQPAHLLLGHALLLLTEALARLVLLCPALPQIDQVYVLTKFERH